MNVIMMQTHLVETYTLILCSQSEVGYFPKSLRTLDGYNWVNDEVIRAYSAALSLTLKCTGCYLGSRSLDVVFFGMLIPICLCVQL